MTRLVVGLGNPGPEYEKTRHNVGFEVLERLAGGKSLFQTASKLAKSDGYAGPRAFQWARLSKPAAFLLMPETFMNRSGEVVLPIARFLWEDVRTEDVLVVYDDMDLPVAGLRIRPHGGAGGQKGMRSIIETLGTDRFRRLRIGIGRPGTDAARHVLSRFDANERVEMDISVAEASEAILDWLETGDIEGCMTRFHSRWTQDS